MERERRHIIGLVLVAIFVTYWASINFYSHTHEIEGETLVHSHPYTGTSHSHSVTSFSTIGWLSALFNLVEPAEQISQRLFEELPFEVFRREVSEKYYSEIGVVMALRGPPYYRV